GARIQGVRWNTGATLAIDQVRVTDALGGTAYYMGRLELAFPTSSGLTSVGLRPSAFMDAGSLWSMTQPILTDVIASCVPVTANSAGHVFEIVPGSGPQTCGADSGTAGFTRVPGFKEVFL